MGIQRQLPVRFRRSPILKEGSDGANMSQLSAVFGISLQVGADRRALPWGMLRIATVGLTPKVHDLPGYPSGFT